MFYFCTFFDYNFISRGLALYRSLTRHSISFHLWILCLDDLTYEILQGLGLPRISPISLADFEKGDTRLLSVKKTRSRFEYCLTCTPSLPLYILKYYPDVDVITYVDADLFFFSDPSPIYEELSSKSILIVEHHFPSYLSHLEVVGIYNVGLLSFRRDSIGLKCLQWWRRRCLEWCYDRVEDGRFGDQKYLDDWPTRFHGVTVSRHKGICMGPWNIMNYNLRVNKEQVVVDSHPLICYHFSGLKKLTEWLYDLGLAQYRYRANLLVRRRIYGPYVKDLQETNRWVSPISARALVREGVPTTLRGYISHSMRKTVINPLFLIRMISRCPFLFVVGRYII